MAYTTVLTDIPKQITAGESISWLVTLADYPASASWVLTYTLVKSDTQIQFISTADGDSHVIEIPFATSAGYTAGEYRYQAHVSNGAERYQVGSGQVEILADFATKTSGHDGRNWLDIAIDALEASIQGRASKTQLEQAVGNGLQVKHISPGEQLELLERLKRRRLNKQILATCGKPLKVRF